jgi:HD-GYP domain-containing protein (c-di-GMP phosphodiesterase class II)
VLVEVAHRMREAARTHDVCARLGGEEMAWLLPESGGPAAHAAAERLRSAIADVPVEPAGRITASFGVADLDDGCDADELYRRADAALYWSKEAGRDRVSLHSQALADEISAAERDRARQETPTRRALRALAWAVDERDPASTADSERVAALAAMVARALGWPRVQVDLLAEAALVHDVGKVGVPDRILWRDGPLDQDERVLLQRHLVRGAEVVQAVLGERAGLWIRHLNERWDGGGYPDCLAGEAIPEGARIIGLAAAFAAMTADRPWRPALGTDAALAECQAAAGSQFWPDAVAALALVAPLAGAPETPAAT